MKRVFIPVNDRPECAIALHHGFSLGKRLKANIVGCHIRTHRDSKVRVPSETTNSNISIDSYDKAWERTLKENDSDHIKAQFLFKNIAKQFDYKLANRHRKKPHAKWQEKAGAPDKLFAIEGPISDLIIVSRPEKKGSSLAKTFVLNAVLKSSSPVLVLPQKNVKSVGKRVCIAWNQSPEAMHAIKSSMPIIQQAESVSIITCGAEYRLGPKAKHILKYFRHWNIKARHIRVSSSSDKKAILKGYKNTDSDLLIMGGYSRSRLRQLIFGGVTEYMLNKAQIPVLLVHK